MTIPIFAYQEKLKNLFRSRENVWNYFAKPTDEDKEREELLQTILKNTYRFSSDSNPELYQLAKECLGTLQLNDLQVILYQSQNSKEDNAQLFFVGNEAHILFSGEVLDKLNFFEKKALIAHELAHVELYRRDEGAYLVSSKIIRAISNDASSPVTYFETARKSNLFTELYCDTGAMQCTDAESVISMLIKIHTGLKDVSPKDYVLQVNEILQKKNEVTAGTTHPELYYRVKWIGLVDQEEENRQETIEQLFSGQPKIEDIDLFFQKELEQKTEQILQWMLLPNWLQTETTLNMARNYFPKFAIHPVTISDEFIAEISEFSSSIKNYFAYILMDIILCNSETQEPAMANAMQIAEVLNMKLELEKAIKKENKLNAREFKHQLAVAMETLNKLSESSLQAIQE